MESKLALSGVAKVLYDRANFLGLSMIDEGTFQTEDDLKTLLDSFADFELDNDDINNLLNQGYLVTNWENIREIDIKTIDYEKHVITCIDELSVIDDFTPIYDPTHQKWILGFSNKGWLEIDGAIDVYTGTIGYFNSQTLVYRPVASLPMDTVELLDRITDNYWFGMERNSDKITRV